MAPEVWLPWLRVPKLRPLWPRPLSIGGSRTFWAFLLDTPTFASTTLRKGQRRKCGVPSFSAEKSWVPRRRRLSNEPTLLWGRRWATLLLGHQDSHAHGLLFITLAMTHDGTTLLML